MRYLAAALIISGTTGGAAAAPLDSAVARYYQCFDSSTRSQFNANVSADPNMVAELAFQACSTEEQIILTRLSLATVPANQALAVILRHRAHLKRKITG